MSGTPVAERNGGPTLDGPELVAELQRPEVQELLSNRAPALRALFERVTGQVRRLVGTPPAPASPAAPDRSPPSRAR